MTNLKYDPLQDKTPAGVVEKNITVNFKIKDNGISCCALLIKKDDENEFKKHIMEKQNDCFEINLSFDKSGHYWYCFEVSVNNETLYLNKTYDNFSYLSKTINESFLQLVTEKPYNQKNQLEGGIIYQIFVDRFCKKGKVLSREPLIYREDWGGKIKKNSNDPLIINREVFGGNFEGIISKLDYLKELGITAIYLSPISMANSNHKYDTADYMTIDPMFGDEKTFKKLIDEAKNRNIKIIIDGVYNHTGSDSIYFNKESRFNDLGAFQSQESKYFKWYGFENWPDKYASWWGIDTLPTINHECSEFQNYITGENGVLDKYLKLGVSGVRLDVVDEITDDFVKKITNRVESYGSDKIIMGEVWEDASTKISYSNRRKYFTENELSSVMNYPIKESLLNFIKTKDSFDLVSTIRMLQNNYPKAVLDNLMNFLSTHDTSRFYSDLKQIEPDDDKNFGLLKIAIAILFTLPGVPCIFYGDEYGMENNDGNSRNCFDWENYKTNIYDWYCKISKIRKLSVLKDGKTNIIFSKDGKFVFERFNEKMRIIILSNLKPSLLEVDLEGKYVSFLTGKIRNGKFSLNENELEILIEEKKEKK